MTLKTTFIFFFCLFLYPQKSISFFDRFKNFISHKKIEKALLNQSFDKAKALLLPKQVKDPNDPTIDYNLGLANYGKQKFDLAIHNFERAHARSINNPSLTHQEAINLQTQAALNAGTAHHAQAMQYCQEKSHDKALKAIEQASAWYSEAKQYLPENEIITAKEAHLEQLKKMLEQKEEENKENQQNQKNDQNQDQRQNKNKENQEKAQNDQEKKENKKEQEQKESNSCDPCDKKNEKKDSAQETENKNDQKEKEEESLKEETTEETQEKKNKQNEVKEEKKEEDVEASQSAEKKEAIEKQEQEEKEESMSNQETYQQKRLRALVEALEQQESNAQKEHLKRRSIISAKPTAEGQKTW